MHPSTPLSLNFLMSEKEENSSGVYCIGGFKGLMYIMTLVQHARYIVGTQFI